MDKLKLFLPPAFKVTDVARLHDFIKKYNFCTLITHTTDNVSISHLPLMLDTTVAPYGVLIGHMAKANPQWKEFSEGHTTCVFNGPHAYISPRWYKDTPEAPTWNYANVYASGTPRLIQDKNRIKNNY